MFNRRRPASEILVSTDQYSITRGDLFTLSLKGKGWLSDTVIDFYCTLLQGEYPACHFFGLAFLSKLYLETDSYDYRKVERWTRRRSVLDCDKLFMPAYIGNHFVLICVNIREQRIEYYD